MKKTFRIIAAFIAVVMSVVVWSCSDDDKNEAIPVNQLPDIAQSFIKNHYGGVPVASVIRDNDNGIVEYDVRFSNGQEVSFDAVGQWSDVGAPWHLTIPDGIAPEPIVEYISANYAGEGINEISRGPGGYEVELTNGTGLFFDPDGNFVMVG